ncbi:hypothetical protein Bca52824_026669 [Brassica carinata]|uniref:Ubiquitin-like protease family profile domain-containing protein n=1 Tax=Brassica carinata TaxID=52824 RepID=A0A8X7VAC0_BRACI|nr:hypothetical protein Bca52824_026669 [Brassica carinata]
MEADTEVEESVQVDKQKQGRENKEQTQDDEEQQVGADGEVNEQMYKKVIIFRNYKSVNEQEQKKSGEKRKDEAHEKDKEKNQDEDGSMSNSEKLDKLIQMVDLGKRVEVIQNVLGVKPTAMIHKVHPMMKMKKKQILQLTEVNTIGENEITEKITQDEEAEKIEKESCMKQKSQVTSSSQTFTTPNFDTRVTSPTPTYTTPKFDLLSQESRHSGKGTTEEEVNEVKYHPFIHNHHLREQGRNIRLIHPFEPVDKTRNEKMTEWKMSNKNKEIVKAKWFSDLETPGRKLLKTHIEAGLELLKLRKRNNPDLFLNKTALVVGVKFLEEIDELYDRFLDDKEEKYWLGIVVNLEKRNITAFNSAAVKYTDASVGAYVNAYAMVLPFMIRNIFKDVNVDTSKFAINVVSEGFPQVLKIENSGVYALKLIECHAMRIVDFTNLSEEKIAFITEKLAVDIFSELQ